MKPYSGESAGSFSAASRISAAPPLPLLSSSTSSLVAYFIQNLEHAPPVSSRRPCRAHGPHAVQKLLLVGRGVPSSGFVLRSLECLGQLRCLQAVQ